jgi:nucleoside-diphosphate-sugar epimerase
MPDTVDFTRKPVLVLGASGFIGSRVVAALAAHPKFRPVAASRRSGLMLDATDSDAMRAALVDMPFVINCIAGSGPVMVRSTKTLSDAARMAPPRRMVHLSSMAVYGAATGTVREDQPQVAPVSGYGQAKIECERVRDRKSAMDDPAHAAAARRADRRPGHCRRRTLQPCLH